MLINKNNIKKFLSISLIASTLLMSTGCDDFTELSDDDKKKFDKGINTENVFNIKDQAAIDYIVVDKFVYKTDSINHDLNVRAFVKIRNTGITSLDEVVKKFKIPITVDEKIRTQLVGDMRLSGDISDVLDKFTAMTNTFWTVDSGVIKIIAEKSIIYKLPMFTNDKLSKIYNIGQTQDMLELDDIKDDVFEEIKEMLETVLKAPSIEGEIKNLSSIATQNTNTVNEDENREFKSKESLLKEDKSDLSKNNENIVKNNEKKLTSVKSNQLKKEENGIKPKSGRKKGKGSSLGEMINTDLNTLKYDSKDVKGSEGSNQKNNFSSNKLNNTEISKVNNDSQSNQRKQNSNKTSTIITKEEASDIKKIFKEKEHKVMISKESGIIVVSVTRSEEAAVDNVLNSLIRNTLNNMVSLDVYILEVKTEKLKEFNMNLKAVVQNGLDVTGLEIGRDSITGVIDGITGHQTAGAPTIDGSKVSAVLGYLTGNEKGKILSQPKILMMPNVPSRIKTSTAIPYIEPQSINAGGESSVTYQIKYVNDGIDMAVVSNVVGSDIYLSIGININQYLNDKSIEVGSLGIIDVPIQAPRILNSTFRMKAGSLSLLGGMNRVTHTSVDHQNTFIPVDLKNNFSERSIVVLSLPRLIKFVEKGEKEAIEKKYKREALKRQFIKYDNTNTKNSKTNFVKIDKLK